MGGWRVHCWGWRGLLAAVLLRAPAWAEEAEPVEVPGTAATEEPPAAPPAPAEKPQGGKTDEAPERHLRVFGRVYARASADEREEFARTLKIPSARVGLSASLGNVDGEVSADLSSKNLLKDAFVRLSDDSKRLRLHAGQFKAPFLARELTSSWDLPVMRRGLVADYLVDTNELGGRRLGLMGEVRLKHAWNLAVSGGLFQGAPATGGERRGEDAAGRVSVRPFKRLTVGASTYLGEVLHGTRRHAVSGDATLHLGGFALSGEFVTGRLPQGPFDARLALAHYTLPVGATKQWALQPVLGGEALRQRGDVAGQGWSALGGLNVLYAAAFKAQLQAERALRPGEATPGLEYSLQLATRF